MTAEKIKERIEQLKGGLAQLQNVKKELEARIQKVVADSFATDGALKECEHWLEQLERRDTFNPSNGLDRLEDRVGSPFVK